MKELPFLAAQEQTLIMGEGEREGERQGEGKEEGEGPLFIKSRGIEWSLKNNGSRQIFGGSRKSRRLKL